MQLKIESTVSDKKVANYLRGLLNEGAVLMWRYGNFIVLRCRGDKLTVTRAPDVYEPALFRIPINPEGIYDIEAAIAVLDDEYRALCLTAYAFINSIVNTWADPVLVFGDRTVTVRDRHGTRERWVTGRRETALRVALNCKGVHTYDARYVRDLLYERKLRSYRRIADDTNR